MILERKSCTGLRVERSGVEVVYYICNRLDCAIPEDLSQLKTFWLVVLQLSGRQTS